MNSNQLEQALSYARNNDIESWVHEFLLNDGRNKPLSDGLKKQKRFWIGPKEIELSLMPRISGPEVHMEYVVEKKGFDEKTQRMVKDLKSGWMPAPLIVEYRDGVLSLRDGNHRREALETAGFKKYWTVIWFNSEKDLQNFDA